MYLLIALQGSDGLIQTQDYTAFVGHYTKPKLANQGKGFTGGSVHRIRGKGERVWGRRGAKMHCADLNENVSHRLRYLSPWSAYGGTGWGGRLECGGFAEESMSLRGGH